MSEPIKPAFYEFADFRVDAEKRLLWRGDIQISLTPKVFETLLIFLQNAGEVLEKDRLMNLLWADSFVEEANLAQNVAVLRKALGESSTEHKFILTVPGRGYRFIAAVRRIASSDIETDVSLGESQKQGEESMDLKGRSAAPLKRPRSVLLILGIIIVVAIVIVGLWLMLGRRAGSNVAVVSRTAQLTTWTGLDCYPSLSPDGNSIAFSTDRTGSFQIFVKQIVSGAREVQLTSDGGQNFQPTFSPDGSLIAYHARKRGGIWIIPAGGGTPRQIAEFGSHPTFSPDGQTVAFQSDPLTDLGPGVRNGMPPSAIWAVSINGIELHRITEPGNPPGGHGAPSYSPDGSRIVFDVNDFGRSDVWTVSAKGDDLRSVVENGSDAVYSPDGSSIFFVANRGLAIQKVIISKNGIPSGDPIKVTDATGSRIRQLSLSLKSKRILYCVLSISSNIWSTPLNSATDEANGDAIQLTHNANVRTMQPAFSPDGKKIAFQSFDTTGTTAQIWTIDTDGKSLEQLATGGGLTPWWFPDGKRIGYLSNRDNKVGFFSIAVDTGKETKHFEFAQDVSAARLSPNGKYVAFNSNKGGAINIWVIPIDGGEPKQLTFDKEAMSFPSWSPDGNWLAMGIKRGEDSLLGILPASGGEPIQLTSEKGTSWVYDWSPDSDKLIFSTMHDGIWNVFWISRSTKQIKQITNFSKLNSYVRYAAWSPQNDRIAYEYAETTGNIWMIELK